MAKKKKKRTGWVPHSIKLSRMEAIALLKLMKFVRTSFMDGAAFLAPVERAAMERLENELRGVLDRGKAARSVELADEIVSDYVRLNMRRSKARRTRRHDVPCALPEGGE